MDIVAIMKGLFGMVVLPSILGVLVHQYEKPAVTKTISQALSPFSKIGLFVVVSINSSIVAPYLRELNAEFFSKAEIVYTGGMRNISAGTVLAISFFPPAVAVPVLFQQVLVALFGFLLNRFELRTPCCG